MPSLGRRGSSFGQAGEQRRDDVLQSGEGLLHELGVVPVSVPVLDVVGLDPVEAGLGAGPADAGTRGRVRGVAADHDDLAVVIGEPPQDHLRYEVVPGHGPSLGPPAATRRRPAPPRRSGRVRARERSVRTAVLVRPAHDRPPFHVPGSGDDGPIAGLLGRFQSRSCRWFFDAREGDTAHWRAAPTEGPR